MDKYKDDQIDLNMWVADNVRYIRENNMGHLCESARSIFIVEANELVWSAHSLMSFKVAVS